MKKQYFIVPIIDEHMLDVVIVEMIYKRYESKDEAVKEALKWSGIHRRAYNICCVETEVKQFV